MGLNSSYMSIGQIMGPILGGAFASIALPLPFLAAGLTAVFCFYLSFKVLKPGVKKDSAF